MLTSLDYKNINVFLARTRLEGSEALVLVNLQQKIALEAKNAEEREKEDAKAPAS